MKICVFGAGYVGLVTAACLAEMGNSVVCLDIDEARVAGLQRGEMPIHEPGLAELVLRNSEQGRLEFTTDAARAVAHGTIAFIAVGTPAAEDGSADLEHVLAAAATIGRHMRDYKVVVDKSTVPVGTAERVRQVIEAELKRRAAVLPFAVVSNPEFLKEGAAIEDFMRPDRIVLGADDEQAMLLMRALYAPFQRNHERLFLMDVRSAEMTKYVANAMLAARISFMNEMAMLAERLGADIEQVRQGIGSDPRIGTHFLYAGCGWGGSCLPKDVRALNYRATQLDVDSPLISSLMPSRPWGSPFSSHSGEMRVCSSMRWPSGVCTQYSAVSSRSVRSTRSSSTRWPRRCCSPSRRSRTCSTRRTPCSKAPSALTSWIIGSTYSSQVARTSA